MAFQLIQQNAIPQNSLASSWSLTLNANLTSGNAVVVLVAQNNNARFISGVSDGVGNPYNTIYNGVFTGTGGANNGTIALFYAYNIMGGTNNFNVNIGGGTGNGMVMLYEYSGFSKTNPLDKFTLSNANTTQSFNSGATVNTSQNNELVLGALGVQSSNTTVTVGSGYGNLLSGQNNVTVAFEDKTISSAAAQTATFTTGTTTSGNCFVVTFVGPASANPLPQIITKRSRQIRNWRTI